MLTWIMGMVLRVGMRMGVSALAVYGAYWWLLAHVGGVPPVSAGELADVMGMAREGWLHLAQMLDAR